MVKKIKLGILGCGRVCEHYVEKILILKSRRVYEVVACCDVDENKSKIVAERFSCKAFSDINDFIQYNDMEVVVILTKAVNIMNMQKYVCLTI